jgi:hypothetical protein
MKEWVINFIDQTGMPTSITVQKDHEPSSEDAAELIRAQLFPVIDKADLNDYQGRVDKPTERSLKEHGGVKIISITAAA